MATETIENYHVQRTNDRHLYLDILYWGVLGGSLISFLGIYLARIGATSFQLSILSAGPALVNMLISLPAGKWMEKRSFVKVAFHTSLLHRGGYAVILLAMLLFAEHLHTSMILWITVIMSIPGAVLMIAFNAMFAELVSPDRRGIVVGRRNALLAVSMTTTSLLAGQMLARIVYPLNYQIVFGIGLVGGLLSCLELGRLREFPMHDPPQRVGQPILDRALPGRVGLPFSKGYIPGMRFLTRGVKVVRWDLLHGEFGIFLGAMFVFYITQNLVIPLFPPYYIDQIDLTDAEISLGTAFFQVTVFITSMQLGRVSDKLGHHGLMVISVLGYAAFPLFIGIWPTATSYMLGAAVGGLGWGFLGGSTANRLMERVPPGDRPAHMALFNIVVNLGVLIGSLSGPLVGDLTGLQAAMIIGGVLRLLSSLVLWRWG